MISWIIRLAFRVLIKRLQRFRLLRVLCNWLCAVSNCSRYFCGSTLQRGSGRHMLQTIAPLPAGASGDRPHQPMGLQQRRQSPALGSKPSGMCGLYCSKETINRPGSGSDTTFHLGTRCAVASRSFRRLPWLTDFAACFLLPRCGDSPANQGPGLRQWRSATSGFQDSAAERHAPAAGWTC